MPGKYDEVKQQLSAHPRRWLVTGVAGFIGSNILQRLLELDQEVVGLDNFATGHEHNLEDVRSCVGNERWTRFEMHRGDIADLDDCRAACKGVELVLHQAALGSVPRSIEDPIGTNRANVDGFLNMLVAARDCGAKRFVYAESSACYGDHPALPKVEDQIGRPLSPYAVTKRVNALYAGVFTSCYGLESIGIRYFNVYGARQDPHGAYAAVIPRWVDALLRHEPCQINGDGETSRDFCYVGDAVQANLLAATTSHADAVDQVYNIAYGDRTTLKALFENIRDGLAAFDETIAAAKPTYADFRPGDVRHSLANVDKARKLLGYDPTHAIDRGLGEALEWYVEDARSTHRSTP